MFLVSRLYLITSEKYWLDLLLAAFSSIINLVLYSAAPSTRSPIPNASPVCFVLEEARTMIPSGRDDETSSSSLLCRSTVRAIAFEGRKYNLGFVLVSQKPRSVDEACASQANTFIIHQLKSPDDLKYVS